MQAPMQIFLILLLVGLFLVGAEIFVPGAVLGVIGGLALLAAIALAFSIFTPYTAFMIAIGVIVLLGICLVLWIRLFPRTAIGRSLTLSKEVRTSGTPEDLYDLLNHEGIAESALRPGGIAKLAGRRVDVVAEGAWIQAGTPVRVIEVEGNRVVVREVRPPPAAGTEPDRSL